ncbi:MAG TPA: HEAT repeat domain-containing protein [Phycisphaerae bacterium]|nr:HEAT repeat domain-containing protein [Phycisphaerae bacterium]HRW54714.1 HEAT repeat domain-containing protein [Phycisphaerae bacterium]
MNTHENFSDRIVDKLERVRARGLKCFGSEQHGFRLNPPLSEEAVRAFEAEHGVRLPEDYRAFLTKVGNGGAGPYYGLYPLEKWNAIAAEHIPDQLATPCPILREHANGEDLRDAIGCDWEDCFRGVIALCTQGCTYSAGMIVTGPHRGQIVYFNEEGPACYFIDHTDFVSWYERWLDELLAGFDDGWFGFGKAGDEASLAAILDDPHASADDIVDAMRSLSRMPTLSEATRKALRRLQSHESGDVRSRIPHLLVKGDFAGAAESLTAGLSDAEEEVRATSLSAMAQGAAPNWREAARAALSDSRFRIATNAARLLEQDGQLTQEDIQRLLESSDKSVRAIALDYWGRNARRMRDVAFPLELITHPDVAIRRAAILAARDLKLADAVPILAVRLDAEADNIIRGIIVRALVEMADRRALPALLESATSKDDFVRYHVARGLRNFRGRDVLIALKKLAQDHTTPLQLDQQGRPIATTVCTIAHVARQSRRRVLMRTIFPFIR